MTTTVLICRKWNNPQISITVNNEGIAIEIALADFLAALADESAEELAGQIAGSAGNPFLLVTNAQLVKRLVEAVEGEDARRILQGAAERVITTLKEQTARVV